MRRTLLTTLLLGTCLATPATAVEFQARQDGEFIVLDNGNSLRVAIAPDRGGELAGFSVRIDGAWHELLYRAQDYTDRPGWRGKAPLLWPATGISLTEAHGQNRYLLEGRAYEMPFHGFARHHAWKVLDTAATPDSASTTLQLLPDAETRRFYPFEFDLRVEYLLNQSSLAINYEIAADPGNDRPMPFSIGNHVTFRAPLIPGPHPSTLEFATDLPDRLLTGSDKAFTGSVEPSPFIGRRSMGILPRREAVSLSGPWGAPVELAVIDPSGFGLRLVHQVSSAPSLPAIRFNLWADAEDGFFSPEPWVGTQNSLNNGMGLVRLEPGETWNWKIEIIPGRIAAPETQEDRKLP